MKPIGRRRPLPILSVVTGAALLVASVGLWLLRSESGSGEPASLPPRLAGLRLATWITGPEAAAEITQLHARSLPIAVTSAAIGHYGDAGQITLWLAHMPDLAAASSLLDAMTQRIAQGDTPFREVGRQPRSIGQLVEMEGMGQRHMTYVSGRSILWLAANVPLADSALSDLLEVYP